MDTEAGRAAKLCVASRCVTSVPTTFYSERKAIAAMRIIFFGTPEFAVPSLERLIGEGYEVVTVVTQPDRAKGRGRKETAPPVKELALSKGIIVLQPESIKSPEFTAQLSGLRPDAIVVVAYGKIVPPALLRLPAFGCINVHASLLPRYRGAAPIQRALINGETRTGVTTMLMDEGLDTGDVLLQEEIEVGEEDDALTLSVRLSGLGAALLTKTLDGLRSHSVQPTPQKGDPSFAPPLRKGEGKIEWSLSAKEIRDLIRGTYPWPGAYCSLRGERIAILKGKAVESNGAYFPGRVEKVRENEFHIGTGKGVLAVLQVKPEGRKAMSASDFARGRRLRAGVSFDLS